jgi:hypothetical protein
MLKHDFAREATVEAFPSSGQCSETLKPQTSARCPYYLSWSTATIPPTLEPHAFTSPRATAGPVPPSFPTIKGVLNYARHPNCVAARFLCQYLGKAASTPDVSLRNQALGGTRCWFVNCNCDVRHTPM